MGTVCEAVNVGYDTDTVAAIAGSIAGALNGTKGIDLSLISVLDRENEIHLEETAKQAAELAAEK